jgi:hypothetical protein
VFVFTRFARGGGSLAHHRVKSITLFFSHNLTGRQFLIQQGALARYQQLLLVTGASRWLGAVGWVMLSENSLRMLWPHQHVRTIQLRERK